ncbi:MAG: LptF/LptG family permease [Verrucomicrobiia bacterium]
MKTIYKYITREVLITLVMTVFVFTGILMLGNIIREVFTLLFNESVTIKIVLKAILLLIPYILVFALPMGMMTASILVFGRLSAEQELIAIKSGGINPLVLTIPVIFISILCSFICGFINLYWAPKCRVAYKDLLYEIGAKRPATIFTQGRFVKDIPGYIVYVGKINGNELVDIMISKVEENGMISGSLRAPNGKVQRADKSDEFTLTLYEARGATIERGGWQPLFFKEWSQQMKLPKRGSRRIKLNELTFFQLQEEVDKMKDLLRATPSVPHLLPGELREKLNEFNKPIYDFACPIKVQIHQQVSFSFACIGFTLLGIPLGIKTHRKETSIGVAIALVLVLIYYSFYILSSAIETQSQYAPYLIVWIPNFLFQIIGGVLLWRVNKS